MAIFDRILTNFMQLSYSPSYYLAWLIVLLAIFFAFKLFIFTDWKLFMTQTSKTAPPEEKFIDKKISHHNIDVPMMLIDCPFCNTAKYHLIPESTQKKVKESPSGITTMLIKEMDICEHTFLVYFDKEYKVRSMQKVDIIS
ncbi:MAG: hypothetical protein E4G98_06995 [Promethearchaeota archaeon]|nr:MAG: hypothetical protein E4G98_06995 [Candidatus Lokiarchaeota archaeon]